MSESKGISLRRKKPTTTRPTISGPIPTPVSQLSSRDPSATRNDSEYSAVSHERPRLGGHTSDLVKRRYSTRFGPGHDGAAPHLLPPLPTMPIQFMEDSVSPRTISRPPPSRDGRASPDKGDRERGKSTGRGKLKVDMRALKDPNLQAEKYVQSILADATEQDIHAYQKDLQAVKAHTDSDLQHNVYQNRTQFIKISKEADKLKTEMRTLRTLMGELTGALGHATSAAGADINAASTLSIADRKRANRTSVANLEAMWSTHLQTLWKRVEGSQKYLPALPGRHILMESQRWVELNAATWKPKRRVALVLLNDHLLVAIEKKRPAEAVTQKSNRMSVYGGNRQSMYGGPQTQTTLVADRCWPLHDVNVADISTRSSHSSNKKEDKAVANAVNVRAGNESFTYATADESEKLNLLVAFRKAQEDRRKQLALEHGKRGKSVDELTMISAHDPRSLKKAAAAAIEAENAKGLGGLTRSNSVLIDTEGRPQSVRWVESQIDGLDINIALQHFEDAVGRVETLRKMARGIKGNQVAQEIIQAKVNERAARLSNSISRQLHVASSGMSATKESVSWLLRLGFEELARITYLSSRTETIRTRTRQLPFTGALEPYVHALAFTTFALMLHTLRTFNASFPPTSGSAVIRWAKERVDEFNGALERHLSNVETGSATWDACVATVKEQAGVLVEVGVDFQGQIARDLEGARERAMTRTRAGRSEGVGLGLS